MISGIVLAAGAAERMGRQKLLLDFKGKAVLQWVLEEALSSQLDEVICVVRELREVQQKISLKHRKLRWISNPKASQGQGTSVVAGLKAIGPQSEAALFLLGDQPLVKGELIHGLLSLYRSGAAQIVAPTCRGESRSPVLFHRDLFPELLESTGDRGGKALIDRHRDKALFLEWNDEKPFLDIDTWEDYERLKAI